MQAESSIVDHRWYDGRQIEREAEVRRNGYFKKKLLSAITRSDTQEYKVWRLTQPQRNGRPVKRITVRHDLTSLGMFFKYGIVKNWCHTNPVDSHDIPSDKEAVRIHVLTSEEETWYFARLRALKLLQLHDLGRLEILMGCRPEEIAVLETSHVDLEPTDFQPSRLRIVEGKTAAAKRTLPFAAEAGVILARLKTTAEKAESKYLFHAERNVKLPLSMPTIETQQAKVDAPFVLYDLRHTFATRAILSKKVDLPQLAAILGDDGIRSVMKSVHVRDLR